MTTRKLLHSIRSFLLPALLAACIGLLAGCAGFGGPQPFRDSTMDFGSIHTVAVMPLANLTRDNLAGERVRDVFVTSLLATGGVYVVPVGEVTRAFTRAGVVNPLAPSVEEIVKVGGLLKADAIITGTVREYGEVRSGGAVANVISLSMQMAEAQTGKVVWNASTTKGGVSVTDRLFGGGGVPMNVVTEMGVDDIINKLLP